MSLSDLIDVLPRDHVLKIADKKPELIDWTDLSKRFELPEAFIEQHADLVYWRFIIIYQDLSPSFLKKYLDVFI